MAARSDQQDAADRRPSTTRQGRRAGRTFRPDRAYRRRDNLHSRPDHPAGPTPPSRRRASRGGICGRRRRGGPAEGSAKAASQIANL